MTFSSSGGQLGVVTSMLFSACRIVPARVRVKASELRRPRAWTVGAAAHLPGPSGAKRQIAAWRSASAQALSAGLGGHWSDGAPTFTSRAPSASKTKAESGWRFSCRRLSGRPVTTGASVACGSAASGSNRLIRLISPT